MQGFVRAAVTLSHQHVPLEKYLVTEGDCSPDKWKQIYGPSWWEDFVCADLDDRH